MSSPVDHIRKLQQELTAIRRDIHAHPELAFEERRTSQIGCRVARGAGASRCTVAWRRPEW